MPVGGHLHGRARGYPCAWRSGAVRRSVSLAFPIVGPTAIPNPEGADGRAMHHEHIETVAKNDQ